MGTQLAYAKFTRHFFNHNQKRGNHDSVYSLCAKEHRERFQECSISMTESSEHEIHFGVRSKERKRLPTPPSTIPCSVDELTPTLLEGIFITVENAKSSKQIPKTDFSSQSDHTYFDTGKTVEESFSILQYSLSIFKVVLLLKSLWSAKEINIVKIPFLFQNIKTFLSTSSPGTNEKADSSAIKEILRNTANSLGFTIIPITGDGNCFFTAVAFQVLQILMAPSCPENLHTHLASIRIKSQHNVKELSGRLRQLVVDEWQENAEEYRPFFENIDMHLESEIFRASGEFAGRLGDALPLTMANILQTPILILATVHNMPFLPVVPRNNLNNGIIIYLSYTQEGPGHYDALVATNFTDGSNNVAKTRHSESRKGKIEFFCKNELKYFI